MTYLVGCAEYPAMRVGVSRHGSSLQAAADLALRALADAGLSLQDVDGLVAVGIHEASAFLPATVADYLGLSVSYAETVDLGGASAAAMVWRAAEAVRSGIARVVLCVAPGIAPPLDAQANFPYGASGHAAGAPQAEFEIPYGYLGQNALYALIAQRYDHVHGYDPLATARLVAHQRANAAANPDAIFFGRAVDEADILASRMIARPIRLLEIVMPVQGGAAIVVADAATAARCRSRPVRLAGHGERLSHKSPHHADDMLRPPLEDAARRAFAMAGLSPRDIDAAQLYDCYTINVVLSLEAAGFCARGEAMAFLRDSDMRWDGGFPVNTNGGQLGFGQAGHAGGMTHVVEAVRQIRGEAGGRQVRRCDRVFVSGNGGIMSEQVALILEGA